VKTRSWYVVGGWVAVLTILYGQSPPKQAVIDTSPGTLVMDRSADVAPNHVANFIKLAQEGLDGQYTAFGRVSDGMAVVEAIEASPRNGETPTSRIELKTIRGERKN
jgi:cyclophilin family peptidyl-prolyl cis-trans isomerase